MPKIHKLSKDIVSKIAAGEVVERPASVVKELVENSIDAKAKSITVTLKDAGLKEIIVSDDGVGMNKEDLLECYKRHTTSKVKTLADLDEISLFGFRGEALASISAVSNIVISTKTKKNLEGYFIDLIDSKINNQGILGLPIGTTVEVKNLFYNVPARKKFLKSNNVELKYVTDILTRVALAHLDISFKLFHNGKLLLDIPSDKNYKQRVEGLFSDKTFSNLIGLTSHENHFKLEGFISAPQIARTSKATQYLYVNNRYVKDDLISNVIKKAYKTLIDPKKHPPYILFLTIPHKMVDINVHPQKIEMRVFNKEELLDFIYKSVETVLQQNDLTYIKQGYKVLNDYMNTSIENLNDVKIPDFNDNFFEFQTLQLHNLYLVKEVKDGIELIDQHAAHERIIYNALISSYKNKLMSVVLDNPLILKLEVNDYLILLDNLRVFKKIGFEIKDLGKNTVKVLKAPVLLVDRNMEIVILEVLDEIETYGMPKRIDSKAKQAMSYLACRLAIKDGKKLNSSQRQWLIEQLDETNIKYTCPHGRPTKVHILLGELHNWFKRT